MRVEVASVVFARDQSSVLFAENADSMVNIWVSRGADLMQSVSRWCQIEVKGGSQS